MSIECGYEISCVALQAGCCALQHCPSFINKKQSTILEMREKLKSSIEYNVGLKIRAELHEIAKTTYKPEYKPEEYLKFINSAGGEFSINHAQSVNAPYYFCLFTEGSQRVYGDCAEECLDKAVLKIYKGESCGKRKHIIVS